MAQQTKKKDGAQKADNRRNLRTRSRMLAVAVTSCFVTSLQASNLPTGGVVASGSASFSQVGNVLNVTNSNGTVINWNTFSIGSGYTTNFIQASASSSVLNRVLSSDPSVILGTLSSNGRVFLINPNGIMVGQGAQINVAGFVASTLNLSDANFLANKLQFDATPGAGSVVNKGNITTPSGGSVYLVAPNVSNEGIITTPQGETILAAGQTVTLLDTGTPGVSVEITGAEGNATNLGTIVAEAGRIGIAGVIVRNSGVLNASSAVKEGGRIFLKASQDAYVDGDGRIVTTGTKGGTVEVLGNRVAVMDNASIDASGTSGGGTVLVGGDYQGKNPDVQNSTVTYFGANATIKADATNKGNGGKVIVWADDTTRAYGRISVRGGPNGGNGGLVEVSGKVHLDFNAFVDRLAPKGKSGTLLLDPMNVTITDGTAGTDPYLNSDGGTVSYGGYGGVFGSTGSGMSSTLYWSTIDQQLAYGGVYITTSGNGTGAGDINILASHSYNSSSDLFLYAHHNVNATGVTIHNSNIYGGNIRLVAGWNGSFSSGFPSPSFTPGTGNIVLTNSTIRSDGGDVELAAGNDITLTGSSVTSSDGTVDIAAGRDIKIDSGSSVMGYSVGMYAGRNVVIDGHVEATAGCGGDGCSVINLVAGYNTSYGGNITFGASSSIVTPDGINVTAYGGTDLSGDIVQQAEGVITTGGYSNYFKADGDLKLDGAVHLTNDVELNGYAGYSGALNKTLRISHLFTGAGLITLASSGNVSLGIDGNVHTNLLDITGHNITVKSNTGDLYIDGGSFSLANSTDTLSLDAANDMFASSSLSVPNNLSLHAGRDFTLTGGADIFGYNVSVNVGRELNLSSSSGYAYLGADNTLNVHAGSVSLSGSGTELFSHKALSVKTGSFVIDNGAHVWADDSVAVDADTVDLINGGHIHAYGDYGGGVFIKAADVNLHNGGYAAAYNSDVSMEITDGDLTLNDGSYIQAGNEVLLKLTGANAKVVLNDGTPDQSISTISTGSPSTTHITFNGRSSGGVVIEGVGTTTTTNGGSGFYAMGSPAALGHGLEVNYLGGSIGSIVTNVTDQYFNILTDPVGPDTTVTDGDEEQSLVETTTNQEGNDQNGQEKTLVGQCV